MFIDPTFYTNMASMQCHGESTTDFASGRSYTLPSMGTASGSWRNWIELTAIARRLVPKCYLEHRHRHRLLHSRFSGSQYPGLQLSETHADEWSTQATDDCTERVNPMNKLYLCSNKQNHLMPRLPEKSKQKKNLGWTNSKKWSTVQTHSKVKHTR